MTEVDSSRRDAEARIGQCRSIWIRAINDGDAEAFVSVLADDAVWLPPGVEALHTKPEIRRWLEPAFQRFRYGYSVDNVRLRVAGQWAAERSDFETRVSDASREQTRVHRGTYTLLWLRTPEGWRIERYLDDGIFDLA